MRKLLPLIFTAFLLITGPVMATSGFYCEDKDNTIIFIITPKNVHVVNDSEESDHEVELNTTMHNNNLLLEINDANNTLHISLDIKEDDLVHVASLQEDNMPKNIDRHYQRPSTPIYTDVSRYSMLHTIYGSIYYKNSEYSVRCTLDNALSLGL